MGDYRQEKNDLVSPRSSSPSSFSFSSSSSSSPSPSPSPSSPSSPSPSPAVTGSHRRGTDQVTSETASPHTKLFPHSSSGPQQARRATSECAPQRHATLFHPTLYRVRRERVRQHRRTLRRRAGISRTTLHRSLGECCCLRLLTLLVL